MQSCDAVASEDGSGPLIRREGWITKSINDRGERGHGGITARAKSGEGRAIDRGLTSREEKTKAG